MDKAKEHALSQYEDIEDEPPIPYEEAPAYEAGTSTSSGNALGTTLTIDPTGMSVIKLPLGSAPPYYTFSKSLLHVNSFSSVDVSRAALDGGKSLALYAIAEEFISSLHHHVRPDFKNVAVSRSTGMFAAIGVRKVVWSFSVQDPIPLKEGKKIDGQVKAGEGSKTTGGYLWTVGNGPIGVTRDLLQFSEQKWVNDHNEVVALAREGGAECEGMPVLSMTKDLDQETMDFLISAWCVTLWGELGKRAHHHKHT
jgi:hypothetical protein